MKILLLAYHISPYRGSECSVAWNHIINMSKHHEITVIYGSSGDHMGDDDDLERFLNNDKVDNVEFIMVKPNKLIDICNSINRKGWLTYSFYMAYNLWHRKVYSYCKNSIPLVNYDLIHYLTPIGYREPGYLWRFDKPYIWGAIGGAPDVDTRLLSELGVLGKLKFFSRRVLNNLQLKFSYRLRKALKNTTVLLTATRENKSIFDNISGRESIYITENGTTGHFCEKNISGQQSNTVINLVWIGSVDYRKNLSLLVDAIKLLEDNSTIHVNVIGGGDLLSGIIEDVNDSKIADCFTFYGQIDRSEVYDVIEKSDLNVITSINEGNPTTIWEVMRFGIPTLTLAHSGMADTVNHDSGFLIEVSDYGKMAFDISELLRELSKNPQILYRLKDNVRRDFYLNHWDKRVKFFNNIYRQAVTKFDESRGI